MLDNTGIRQLAYVVTIDDIRPIPGKDRVECAVVNGWTCMVPKGAFHIGDPGIYFEVDSKLPEEEPFEFLKSKHYKIKIQKYKNSDDSYFWSQGLLMSAEDFGWDKLIKYNPKEEVEVSYIIDKEGNSYNSNDESRFLTTKLKVTYATTEDNKRKSNKDKYQSMAERHKKLFSYQPFKLMMKYKVTKEILFIFFGRKKDKKTGFPTHFQYIKKTDQERVENMTWVLQDKTPFIVTEKCDGSSGTYILERKPFGKFEFYVCSRNVRQLSPKQKSWYDENYYWKCAIKYDIENKLKDYLIKHPELDYVCWQGEVCGPGIQKNPQGLSEIHFFCFHMIDSKIGKWDIRKAVKIWEEYNMEHVPIVTDTHILPDDFELFKESAEGFYPPIICEGKKNKPREGFVYYKTTDPNFSFKNVSRSYLLKHS